MKNLEERKFQNFLKAQQKYINDAKYFEGINTRKDPGNEFILQWINKNAKNFREKWEKSKCKNCEKADKCGNQLKISCDDFKELKNEE